MHVVNWQPKSHIKLEVKFLLVLFSCLNHVWLFTTSWTVHGRLFCPPRSSGVCSDSCPLSQWCYLTISSSATHFSFCLQSSPASRSFQMIQLFASGGQSIGASASASKFQWVDTSLFGPSSFWRGLREVKSTFLLVHINKDNLELRLYKQRDWFC